MFEAIIVWVANVALYMFAVLIVYVCFILHHVSQALRKALFKPAAFFKGILLPLCEVSRNVA